MIPTKKLPGVENIPAKEILFISASILAMGGYLILIGLPFLLFKLTGEPMFLVWIALQMFTFWRFLRHIEAFMLSELKKLKQKAGK